MTRPSGARWSSVEPRLGDPRPVGRLEHRVEPVGRRLIRAEQPERRRVGARSRRAGTCRARASPRSTPSPAVSTSTAYSRKSGRRRSLAAAGRRSRAGWRSSVARRAAPAQRAPGGAPRHRRTARPAGRSGAMSSSSRKCAGFVPHIGHRDLVRSERALGRLAVDLLGPGPALRRSQDDHRPGGASPFAVAGGRLDRDRGHPGPRRSASAIARCTNVGSSPATMYGA